MNFKTYKIGKQYQYYDNKYIPSIHFSGKWLEGLNFYVGEEVVVYAKENTITITKPTEEHKKIIDDKKKEKEIKKLKKQIKLLEKQKGNK